MTRAIAPEVPESVIREIRRRPPPSSVIPLVSLDSEGFPHVALLSFFETVYCEPMLYFFIRAESGTAENLKTRSQCALIFAEVDFLFYLKGRASLKATIADQAVFQFCLTTALEDSSGSDEGKTWIRSGIRFERDAKIDDQRLALRDRVEASLQGLS